MLPFGLIKSVDASVNQDIILVVSPERVAFDSAILYLYCQRLDWPAAKSSLQGKQIYSGVSTRGGLEPKPKFGSQLSRSTD